ncbi:hypothetical protein [Streptomyces roseicoloratus]|uniref:hypothetical protein n=1 Tax=Streptomyces roseicoloratus TaxID=2508722 RepID=UPI0013E94B7C|nr:hypothetical protein [Streptomyces roseicoloratus]
MIFTADEFLAVLDALPHAERLRRTATTAHRLARHGTLRPLLASLDERGPYERRLAALAALAGEDAEHLAARLADPDPVVRRYALRGARRLPVPDAAVEAAYGDAPAVVRVALARLLRDGRRAGLAERLVPVARAEYGERDAARLLPGCSTEFTARLLPELAGALAFEDWSTLAVRHPGAVLDHVERELADLPQRLRNRWWQQHATAIAAALPAGPARVLDLLERYGPDHLPGPVNDRLGELVAVDAERVTRWLADPGRPTVRWERTPRRAVLRRLVAAGPPSLPVLAARWFNREAFDVLLRSVPPARRAAFVDAVTAVGDPRRVHPHANVLAALPAAERHPRVRVAIERSRAERHSGGEERDLLSLLPPAEARPGLCAGLDSADAEWRGAIWNWLVVNAGHSRDPQAVAEVLALAAGRLGNERDLVRWDALSGLAALPAPLLAASLDIRTPGTGAAVVPSGTGVASTRTPEAGVAGVRASAAEASDGGRTGAESLERLCRDALRARDCSHQTRESIRDLALVLLDGAAAPRRPGGATASVETAAGPERAESARGGGAALRTAVRIIEALTAHTGKADLCPPGGMAHLDALDAVLDALGPWLDRAADGGDVVPLLALVRACGKRAYRIPGLQDRLGRALRTCPDGVFGEVAAAWLADPASRGERVAELLAWEPTAAFLPEVLAVLSEQRTDLLDGALSPELPQGGGRFPVAGVRRPLPLFRYADRWLPRQQRAAVRLAADAVADAGRGIDERAALLRAVAPVPEHGRMLLRRYAADPSSEAGGPEGGTRPTGVREPGQPDRAGQGEEDEDAEQGGQGEQAEAALAAAALDAAAHTDDPAAALGALLDHAGDDRAAAAWSAAGRAAAHARPSRVAALIHDVLTLESGVKVTVRKAAVRLATGHLAPRAAIALLSAAGRAPGVHPDVHATVVRMAATLLPAEEMWDLLGSAAAEGPDVSRRALLDVRPTDLAPAHRPRYGELLARLPAVAEEATANEALSRLGDWAPYTPAAGAALADVCTDLTSPLALWRATSGLLELARSDLPHPVGGIGPGSLFHGVVDRLLTLIAAGEPEGGGRGGDLPARRRLRSVIGYAYDHRTCAALARQLEAEPSLRSVRTDLLLRAIDLEAAEPALLDALRDLVAAIGDRPVLAGRVAEKVKGTHRGGPLADSASGLAAVRALGADGGLVEGLLALGLATAIGPRQSWPEVWRASVVELRRHPQREVREAAWDTELGTG